MTHRSTAQKTTNLPGAGPAPGTPCLELTDQEFASLFEEHAPYVLGLLRRLGVRQAEVEDAAQEVFLIVHTERSRFEGRSSLRTWICGIAVRVAHNHRRRAYRRREVPSPIDGTLREPRSEATQHRCTEAKQDALALLEALDRLSYKLRQVFVLYEVEQLPMAEVAGIVGCPRATAYTRLRNARIQVTRHFAQRQRARRRR